MRAIVALAALIAAACGGPAAAPPKPAPAAATNPATSLPGFSVILPAGTLVEDNRGSYETGDLLLELAPGRRISLGWIGGTIVGDVESEQGVLNLFMGVGDEPVSLRATSRLAAPGAATITWQLESARSSQFLSIVTCGRRSIILTAIGAAADAAAVEHLHRDLLASFRCSPDPALEASM